MEFFYEPVGDVVTGIVLSCSLPLNPVDGVLDVGESWQGCVQVRGARHEPALLGPRPPHVSNMFWPQKQLMVLETPLRYCTGLA